MNKLIATWLCVWLIGALTSLLSAGARAAETNQSPVVNFPDKNLEKAVRKFVFEKRDNDKPLVESDLVNLSTIQGVGLGITNLSGLEKCQNLASLDLAKNKIALLTPIQGLLKIQYLNLAENQIEDITPLGDIKALQYIELSHNRVKQIPTLSVLTNLASLYLSFNQISDVSAITNLPKLASLYLDNNHIKTIAGLGHLKGLSMLSLSHNAIADIAPLDGLKGLYHLFLESNKIRDLTPLVKMAKSDKDNSFAPFLNVYLKGNPLSSAARGSQITSLKGCGTKVFN